MPSEGTISPTLPPIFIQAYLKHLLTHVNPYTMVAFKDEPTILAWETGNELHQGDAPFTNWTQDIARYIKEELGAGQLVLDGRHGSFSSVALGNPDVDLLSDHYYSGWDAAIASAKMDSAKVADAKKVQDRILDQGEPLLHSAMTVHALALTILGFLCWRVRRVSHGRCKHRALPECSRDDIDRVG